MSRLLLAVVSVCLLGGVADAQNKTPVRNVLQKCFGPNCQAQSTGFLVVGQSDSRGGIVTWVGPVVDPVPSMAPPLPQAESSIMARRSDFRQVFLKAVKKARDEGEINAFQHGRLVVASLRPRELANIQAWVHENAIQEGLASAQAPDWDAIISFIEKLIPLIIQLIDLFGSNIQANLNEAQYVLKNPVAEPVTVCDWSGLAV